MTPTPSPEQIEDARRLVSMTAYNTFNEQAVAAFLASRDLAHEQEKAELRTELERTSLCLTRADSKHLEWMERAEKAEDAFAEEHAHCKIEYDKRIAAEAALAAYQSATPDSPEVKEAISVADSFEGWALQIRVPVSCLKVLTQALRAALVRIKELEKKL